MTNPNDDVEKAAREYAMNFLKERLEYINQMLPTEIIRMGYKAGHAEAMERVAPLEKRLVELELELKAFKEELGYE